MNGVFSLFVPGDSVFHRLGAGWKFLLMAVATFIGLGAQNVFVSSGLLALALAGSACCGVPVSRAWRLPWGLWLTAALLLGYQALLGKPLTGVVIAANLVMAIYAARILTMTTPGSALVDALVRGLGWLRAFGLDPERIGLAVALMVRSLPVLLDSFNQVRDAARARGRERSYFALVTPVVVRAVGYAQATGQALAARGLGDKGQL
ncbi:MAG: energy-coupling factor transporter transmembrane protein EcfT [Propionibacteriaceae bacterium]|jgi:biotin transport system permease protein|nr:energy-coupling factor transporter transmembrane protein EcfT [Propionibacteriaceae bacterium]